MANQTKKTSNASGGLYIALAICILSVICIGVYSAILNIFDSPQLDMPVADETKNKTDKPNVSLNLPSVTTTPHKEETPGVTTPPQENPAPTPSTALPDQSANAAPA